MVKEIKSLNHYMKCAISGAVACGTTHTLMTPIDLVKCRSQAFPEHLRKQYSNLFKGWATIISQDGLRGLYRGWRATLLGYGSQGMFKFGFYELTRDRLLNNGLSKDLVYGLSAAIAETFGDIALCPFETIKLEVQTSRSIPDDLIIGLKRIHHRKFRALPPIWARQIPYTICKFMCFERCLESLYKHFSIDKYTAPSYVNLSLSFSAGYISGIACAIVSQPADVLVSHMSYVGARKISLLDAIHTLKFSSYWNGLTPRILMIGSLTAMQWFTYDSIKVFLNTNSQSPLDIET